MAQISIYIVLLQPDVPRHQCTLLSVVWMTVYDLYLLPVYHVHLFHACSPVADCARFPYVRVLFCCLSCWLSVQPVCPMYTLPHGPQGIGQTTTAFFFGGVWSLSCTRDCLSVLWGWKQTRTSRGGVPCILHMDLAKWWTYTARYMHGYYFLLLQ